MKNFFYIIEVRGYRRKGEIILALVWTIKAMSYHKPLSMEQLSFLIVSWQSIALVSQRSWVRISLKPPEYLDVYERQLLELSR